MQNKWEQEYSKMGTGMQLKREQGYSINGNKVQ